MADAVSIELSVEALSRMRQADPGPVVLDVREPWELDLCVLPGSLAIPLGDLPNRVNDVPADQPLMVMCHHGVRSLQAALWLRALGYDQAFSIAGGIDAWAARVDPTMRRY